MNQQIFILLYRNVANTDNLNICNPQCCQTQTRGAEKATACEHTTATTCDPCVGRCIEIARENNDWLCPRVECKTKQECCGEDNAKCKPQCGKSTAEYRWDANICGTDIAKCGACCRIVYAGPGSGANVISAACVTDIVLASDCALNDDDTAWLLLNPSHVIQYQWKPFETCETAKCGTKECCGPTCVDDVGCIDIDINATCDPCKGRCYDNVAKTATCKTKQDCCGNNGALCRGCPGNGADIIATGPEFSWGGCFKNGTKCGICCVVTKNALGVAVSSECIDDETYEDCIARAENGEHANWKAFETCASAVCIPRVCCNDVECPDRVICLTVDKDRGECPDFCRSGCYAIPEEGDPPDPPFCATKVDCCGELNEKCVPRAGICPGTQSIPTHSWPNFPDECADPELCGVCCKRNVGTGGAITYSCDDTKDNQTDCTAANYGVWYAFATCAACGPTAQACIEATCKRTVTVNGVDEEQSYTYAACKPVAPDRVNCKGICTELSTPTNPYESKTCKTKSACCGAGNARCGDSCGTAATHSWNSSCVDPEKCGVCCITTNIGGGNISTGIPQENIGRALCEALGGANGGLGVTSVWIPLGTAQDCSIEKCCGTCPDGSISCIDQPPGTPCLQPCNGRCYTVDAAGNVDLTQPDTCATKEACCMQNGINVCQNECKPGKRWTPTCPENAIKCGVACKTTYSGTTILGAECVPGITTLAMLSAAQANLAPNETLTWKPWDTCATVICRAKKCCKEKCPGELACVDVDESDACEPCSGLCYAAVIDPVTDNYVIAPDAVPECRTRSECCGGANEKCASIASCPPQTELKVFVSCDNNCPSGDCLCTDANYAANNDIRSQTRTEPVSGRPFTHWVITEQCQSLLFSLPDPGLSTNNFVGNFNNFVNGSAYSLTYVPVQGPWIEDPCYTSCGEPPTGAADETQYNQCINEQSQLFTTPYEFKPCYPDVLAGQKVYAYAEWCSYGKHPPADYTGNADGHTSTKAGALAFYMCKDKKLVNVTDDIITKKTVKKCSYTRLVFPATTPVSVNTDVDLFNWKFCYTETATGAFTELKTDFSQSCFSGLSVCGAYASPSSEIKDPDMLGCPQPFTANPLP